MERPAWSADGPARTAALRDGGAIPGDGAGGVRFVGRWGSRIDANLEGAVGHAVVGGEVQLVAYLLVRR